MLKSDTDNNKQTAPVVPQLLFTEQKKIKLVRLMQGPPVSRFIALIEEREKLSGFNFNKEEVALIESISQLMIKNNLIHKVGGKKLGVYRDFSYLNETYTDYWVFSQENAKKELELIMEVPFREGALRLTNTDVVQNAGLVFTYYKPAPTSAAAPNPHQFFGSSTCKKLADCFRSLCYSSP